MSRSKGKGDKASVSVDLPRVAGSPSNVPGNGQRPMQSRPILLLGLIVVLAIGVMFFLLRPEQDTAADGTLRETPPTSSSSELDPTEETPALAGPNAEIVPLPIRSDEAPDSIVRIDDGYVGLVSRESLTPTIVRSDSGLIWETVPTSASSLGVPNDEQRRWRKLTAEEGRLIVRSELHEDGPGFTWGDAFISDSGGAWDQLEDIGSLGDHPVPDFPIEAYETHYFAFGLSKAERVTSFVANHTSLDVADKGYCSITTGATEEGADVQAFELRDCGSNSFSGIPRSLDASDVDSRFSTDQVLDCALALATTSFNGALIHQKLGTGGQRTMIDFGAGAQLVSLPSGAVAFVDFASEAETFEERCEGMVDQRTGTEPALVIVDENGQAARWPIPEYELLRSGPDPETRVLGELERENGNLMLLLGHEDGLWEFDSVNGSWSELHPASENAPIGDLESEVRISATGKWAYSISDDLLVAVDLDSGSGRSISVPIAWPDGVEFGSFLHADDDVIFVRSDDDVWRLDVSFVEAE